MDNSELPTSSVPSVVEFDPNIIPFQYKVLKDVRVNFDYSKGVQELLMSGAVGSSKSILAAHLGVTHCLANHKANFLLGRQSMPALKQTILQMVLDHMDCAVDYDHNIQSGIVTFANGSKIIPLSWADKRYKKFRSYAFSSGVIEEGTENDTDDFYKEIKMRMGRIPHIKENFLAVLSNPDSPHHWLWEYFISEKGQSYKNRHVYYSITEDNPFLPRSYIQGIKDTLTLQEVRRMIYGEWIEIKSEVIYYAFDATKSLIDDYKIDYRYPIIISYDFNIGLNKPMSLVIYQRIDAHFYFFDEVVIYGSNTLETLDELFCKGHLGHPAKYKIQGDAAGKARSSKYNRSDYDIIASYLDHVNVPNGRVDYEIDIPNFNPSVRKRHILVNGRLKNSNNETFIHIVKEKCPTLIKGFRLARLKKGGQYIENDSDPWQHISSAAGYGIMRELDHMGNRNNFIIRKR